MLEDRSLLSGFSVAPTTLTTAETGTTDSFTVALTSQPTAQVTVNLSVTDPTEGSLSQSSLLFDSTNWNTPQSVTVTGLDDHVVHGDQAYNVTGTASSGDLTYDGLTMTPVNVTNTEADVAGFSVAPTSLTTSGSGTSDSFGVALTSIPSQPVTVHLGTSVAGQGSLSTSVLAFDSTNWNVPQSVTVTGLDDHVVDGDQSYQVTGVAASGDPNYNSVTMTAVNVTNTENDAVGITVTPTSLTTSETGTTASFSVALTTIPTAPVTINFTPSVAGQGSLSASSLSFDSTNWNILQAITVTGLDDGIIHGDQSYQINGTATSIDTDYNNLTTTPVSVTNTEADTAGFTVSTTSLTTSETGTQANFTVRLKSIPSAPVTLNLATTVAGQGSLSATTLTFDSTNWNIPQQVTVTGLDDHIVHGNQSYQITGTGSSTDNNYNNVGMTAVNVTNNEADTAGFTVTPGSITTSQAGATGSFTVVLTSIPTATVTLNLTPSVAGQGTLSKTSLTFDNTNWNVPQTPPVIVTGLDDHVPHLGNINYQIAGTSTSTDTNYNNKSMTPVQVTNTVSIGQGTVTGTAFLNSADNPLTGVVVTLTGTPTSGPPLPISLTAVTDGNGVFTFTGLPAGTYHVSIGPFTGLLGTVTIGGVSSSPGIDIIAPASLGTQSNVVVNGGVDPNFISLALFFNTSTGADLPFAGAPGGGVPDVTPTSVGVIAPQALSSTTQSKIIDLAGHFVTANPANSSVTMNITANGAPQKINLTMLDTEAPQTVANFFDYVNSGAYNNDFFHRETTVAKDGIGVLQGGGAKITNGVGPSVITAGPTIPDEISASNVKGTLAMANTGGANTASDQFFFNTSDNTTLDPKFTVFAKVADAASQHVLDTLAATPVNDLSFKTATITATGASETGNTVTITTTAAHNLTVGRSVTITGVGVAGYNGTFTVVSVPTPTTFTITNPTAGLAASGSGSLTSGPTFSANSPSLLNTEVPLSGGATTDFPTDASRYLVINSITTNRRDDFLTYSIVSNSNPGLVTATLNNEQLTLTKGTGTGTANITVKATDRFGASLTQTFTVTVT